MDSMTGFGRGEAEAQGIRITAELKSVNHRFLDISIRVPRQLSGLEDCVRAAIKKSFSRGRIEASVFMDTTGIPGRSVSVDMDAVKGYLSAAKKIAADTGVKAKLSMSDILRLPDVVTMEKTDTDDETVKPVLNEALAAACAALAASRRAEAERIIPDMLSRIDTLEDIAARIAEKEPGVIEEYRAKLKSRLEEYLAGAETDPIRFNQEILYFTDKANVTEETVRLKSHFDRLRETLTGSEANGRALDFIVQELNREFNTIGSKSSDLGITNMVITAKGEVEKIREQVQNIE